MVEFRAPNHVDDDDDNDDDDVNTQPMSAATQDILNISFAFRGAADEDTRNVMNAMSDPTPENLERLTFYVIPASWFVKAWPILSARPDIKSNIPLQKEHVGRILNAGLVVQMPERDDAEEDRKPAATYSSSTGSTKFDQAKANMEMFHHRRRTQKQTTTRMRPGLRHAKDYFFVGANVWELVKNKFGYDGYEVRRTSCKATNATVSSTEEEQGTIAIGLLPGEGAHAVAISANGPLPTKDVEFVVIPPTGRFPYEKIVPTLTGSDNCGLAVDTVPEENRNGSNMVTWAEDGGAEETNEEERRIILLPASSTPTKAPSSSPLFTDRMNDMDLDSKSDKDSVSGDGVQFCRRKPLASGLSNLGNTCFMNSTLQCLSNTEHLRKYFLSGDYLRDLNTDNPLGTGGELATEFARLLGEMWGVPSKRRNILGHNSYPNNNSSYSYNSAVVPRDFKTCVGRNAEQFMGYDQHDSQEFATYLLDALHEDTNRVTKKPYIEKPEQGEDEPDDVAAEKAWNLHLQREDSHVLENFMGQVKSRLECPEPGCHRVSTTFDPFMYLSVPIPGSTEKNINLTFVPLDPMKIAQSLDVKISKTGNVADLLEKMNEKLCEVGDLESPIPAEDLAVAEIYNNSVYTLFKVDADVGSIGSNDTIVVYQLRSLTEIKMISDAEESSNICPRWEGKRFTFNPSFMDVQTRSKLNRNNGWMDTLSDEYSISPRATTRILNPKHSNIEGRMDLHKKLENFLDECHEVLRKEESGGLKRARDALDEVGDMNGMEIEEPNAGETELLIRGLVDRCEASPHFCNVRTKQDLSELEFCANKLRQMILKQLDDTRKRSEGIVVFLYFSKKSRHSRTAPLAIRIPGGVTVYEFRRLVADRISRSLVVSHASDDLDVCSQPQNSGEVSEESNEMNTGEPSSEAEAAGRPHNESDGTRSPPIEPSELLILRRAELKISRNEVARPKSFASSSLGMIEEHSESRIAFEGDKKEEQKMDVLGDHGAVLFTWDGEYGDEVFDETEYGRVEKLVQNTLSGNDEKTITVLDCIEKYCQKEQLEESEMWYCNKCKNHVKAWKQFHLHRAPPYLIVHLKRFYFSASSRRRDKISDFIDFPLEGLDLSELVADYDESVKPVYDCYAVSNHIGGLGGGHYTAHVLSDDNETWIHCNDSIIQENVDKEDVVSAQAYVLYYRRLDVPVGQDKEYRIMPPTHQPSPLICETVSPIDQRSEASSTNTAQAGDMDATLDDVASNSSGGATSPMGSVDHGIVHNDDDVFANLNEADDDSDIYGSNLPLQ